MNNTKLHFYADISASFHFQIEQLQPILNSFITFDDKYLETSFHFENKKCLKSEQMQKIIIFWNKTLLNCNPINFNAFQNILSEE